MGLCPRTNICSVSLETAQILDLALTFYPNIFAFFPKRVQENENKREYSLVLDIKATQDVILITVEV